jgi:osmoprotectant transport system permease protein
MEWASKNWASILELTVTHLAVSLVPIFLGSVFAIIAARVVSRKFAPGVNAFLGAVYAVPSLALFVTLPILIGTNYLGPTNVIIALTVYVISSMFFSARDAYIQVPDSVLLFSRAQGLGRWQIFWNVEFPLATPGLIAGLRVAAASTVSMASIGAVTGVKNLGYLFLDGFQRKIPEEIASGLVAIFLIALALDLGLWLLGKLFTPWLSKKAQNA